MCCNGMLHPHVTVLPEHVSLVRSLGLSVERLDHREMAFQQPCVLYRRNQCDAYPNHPPACQAYRCSLLKKYERGEIPIEEGLAVVRQIKALMDGGAGHPRLGEGFSRDALASEMAGCWNAEEGLLGAGVEQVANAEAVMKAVTLDVLLQRHFLQDEGQD